LVDAGTDCLQCFDAVGWWQEGHVACKKRWWGECMGILGNTVQLMPLPPIVFAPAKSRMVLPFLVTAHLGSAGRRVIKWVCVMLEQ